MKSYNKNRIFFKYLISLLLAIVFVSVSFDALAKEEEDNGNVVIVFAINYNEYFVNGDLLTMDVSPTILQSRTLLPIRYAAEPLGAGVGWDNKSKKVTVNLDDTSLELWIGESNALVNGQLVPIDPDNPNVKPLIINGRTMLPLRFVAETLGCEVQWDPDTMRVAIIKMGPLADEEEELPDSQESNYDAIKIDTNDYYENYYGTVLTMDTGLLNTPTSTYKWGVTNNKPMNLQYFAFYLKPNGLYKKFTTSIFLDPSSKADLVMDIRKNTRDGIVLKSLTLKPGEILKDIEIDIEDIDKLYFESQIRINHGSIEKIIVGDPVFYKAK